jgi:scyllo-inositol 2-dehydrogenase (NADP+)
VIRVGLAGYGLAGATFHAPLIEACEDMTLAAVMTSRDAPCAVRSLDDMIDRSDLVVVATPNKTHFEIAKAALGAGKHVLIDKPFTATLDEADALIALAERTGGKLTVFQNRRWDGDFLTVRSVLPQLGEVRLFEAHWDRFRTHIRDSWKEQPDGGNGLLADLGPHLIDQALQLFGTPYALSADLAAQRHGAQVDDYFHLNLDYGPLRVVLSASTLVAAPRPRFAVHGTVGSFVKHGLDPQEEQSKAGLAPQQPGFGIDPVQGVLTMSGGISRAVPTERGRYLTFYEALAAAILNGAELPVLAEEAREVMLIIELARQSAREGRRIIV